MAGPILGKARFACADYGFPRLTCGRFRLNPHGLTTLFPLRADDSVRTIPGKIAFVWHAKTFSRFVWQNPRKVIFAWHAKRKKAGIRHAKRKKLGFWPHQTRKPRISATQNALCFLGYPTVSTCVRFHAAIYQEPIPRVTPPRVTCQARPGQHSRTEHAAKGTAPCRFLQETGASPGYRNPRSCRHLTRPRNSAVPPAF